MDQALLGHAGVQSAFVADINILFFIFLIYRVFILN